MSLLQEAADAIRERRSWNKPAVTSQSHLDEERRRIELEERADSVARTMRRDVEELLVDFGTIGTSRETIPSIIFSAIRKRKRPSEFTTRTELRGTILHDEEQIPIELWSRFRDPRNSSRVEVYVGENQLQLVLEDDKPPTIKNWSTNQREATPDQILEYNEAISLFKGGLMREIYGPKPTQIHPSQ